jgi:membrane protein
VVGLPAVDLGRRVIDRFGAVDGGLLAAGIAFNATFALIPLALFASGLAGLFLTDPAARDDIITAVAEVFPPLAGIVDQILTGMAQTSPTASIIGLILAGWGTSRLFASLESAVAQLDGAAPRRGIVHTTVRRVLFVLIVAGILVLALVTGPILSVGQEMVGEGSVASTILNVLLAVLPPALTAVALAVIYRVLPLVRPSWPTIAVPAVVGGLVLVVLTSGFVFLAPRLFAGNAIYGTLGAILVGLIWLNLVFTVILIGAAWVVERRGTPPIPVVRSIPPAPPVPPA